LTSDDIVLRLSDYARYRLPEAQDIKIRDFERIHGGASRETYRFKIHYVLNDTTVNNQLILRLKPENALLKTDFANEFRAYVAFQDTNVPVPESVWFEEDVKWLRNPFFVTENIAKCESERDKIVQSPYLEVREKIGECYTRILAQISKTDPIEIGLFDKKEAPVPDKCWKRELDYWEGMILQDELEPQPIVRAAIRWLRANPPPPAQKIGVVHGDYRIGNFLYDKAGTIQSVMDWELWHLGDPIEDFTWGMNPLWSFPEPEKVGRMIDINRYILLWEAESGLQANPKAVNWWLLFTSVKALSIWIAAGRKYTDGTNKEFILGHTGWIGPDLQNFVILKQMGTAK
jgi:aminoglycoside phosphotransferase (APT) family kinase protein